MKNFLKIIGYIFLIIVLLPIAAIGLYLAVGGSLFIILYILNRKKNGKLEPNKSKNYKTASTVIILLLCFIAFFSYKANPLSLEGYLIVQGITFVGLLPMCFYLLKSLRNNNSID